MDRTKQTEAANAAVHAALAEIQAAGHDPQDVGNVLFAYAIKMMTHHNGKSAVAGHLRAVALQLDAPNPTPLPASSSKH